MWLHLLGEYWFQAYSTGINRLVYSDSSRGDERISLIRSLVIRYCDVKCMTFCRLTATVDKVMLEATHSGCSKVFSIPITSCPEGNREPAILHINMRM
jgi:hypothetical protein